MLFLNGCTERPKRELPALLDAASAAGEPLLLFVLHAPVELANRTGEGYDDLSDEARGVFTGSALLLAWAPLSWTSFGGVLRAESPEAAAEALLHARLPTRNSWRLGLHALERGGDARGRFRTLELAALEQLNLDAPERAALFDAAGRQVRVLQLRG